VSDTSADAPTPTAHPKSAPADRATAGPFDESEANHVRPYIDLGAVKIPPRPDLGVRLEVAEQIQKVLRVALEYEQSTLLVQALAAPRNAGLWAEVRAQITEQIGRQGGLVTPSQGPFGPELRAEASGQPPVRYFGVDGPRWFLQGIVSGKAVVDPAAAAKIEDLYRSIVVVRGNSPMPPRDLLPLNVPPSMQGSAPAQSV
jgi:hypothetical protein